MRPGTATAQEVNQGAAGARALVVADRGAWHRPAARCIKARVRHERAHIHREWALPACARRFRRPFTHARPGELIHRDCRTPINVIDSWDTQWPLVSFHFSHLRPFGACHGLPVQERLRHDRRSGWRRDSAGLRRRARLGHALPFPLWGQAAQRQCTDLNRCVAALRPDDWASSNAAGLPKTPLLVKTAEANSGEIRHALRVGIPGRRARLAARVGRRRFAAGADNAGAIPDNWKVRTKAIATAATCTSKAS